MNTVRRTTSKLSLEKNYYSNCCVSLFTSDHIQKEQTVQQLQELQKSKYFVSGIKTTASFTGYCKHAKQQRTINKSISYKKINFFYWLHAYLPSPTTTTSAPRYKWFWILKLFCQFLWEKNPANPKTRAVFCTVGSLLCCLPLLRWQQTISTGSLEHILMFSSSHAPLCEERLAWIKQIPATPHAKKERALWSPASLHL